MSVFFVGLDPLVIGILFRILVMKEGSVAEFGTVRELAANSTSIFRNMARAAGIDLSNFEGDNYSVHL